jgi:hypothetical protein
MADVLMLAFGLGAQLAPSVSFAGMYYKSSCPQVAKKASNHDQCMSAMMHCEHAANMLSG